jgi:hypothetical protein
MTLVRRNSLSVSVSELLFILNYWNDKIMTSVKLISGLIFPKTEIVTEFKILNLGPDDTQAHPNYRSWKFSVFKPSVCRKMSPFNSKDFN